MGDKARDQKKPVDSPQPQDSSAVHTKLKDIQKTKKSVDARISESSKDTTTITLMSGTGHSRLNLKSLDGESETLAAYRPQARHTKPHDLDEELDPIAHLSRDLKDQDIAHPASFRALNFFGGLITLAWVGLCYLYIENNFGWSAFGNLKPHEFGGFLAGVIAPIAVFWMILAYIMRGADVKLYAEALRGELHSLIFPTEERAARVHEDIEKLIQQSSEMALASKAVLKSIHRARQGLRAEMREFATLAKKGEHHLIRLSGSIEQRSQHLLELTNQIEQRTNNIDKTTKEGATAWDEATKGMLSRAQDIEDTLEKGAERIVDAAENAKTQTEEIKGSLESTYDNLGLKVDDISEKMDSLSAQFDVHADRLGSATDKVSQTTDALSDLLNQQLDDLDGLTSTTLSAIAEASENMQGKQKSLVEGTEKLIERAESAADIVEQQIGGIYDASDHVHSTFKGFEISIQEQAEKLTGSVDGLGKFLGKIEDTGDEALQKLNEAVTSALSSTENMAASIRRSSETIKRATEEAEKRNTTLIGVTQENITELEAKEDAFADKLQLLSNHFGQHMERFSHARDEAQEVNTKFDTCLKEQIQLIEDARENLRGTLNRVGSGIEGPLESLNSVMGELDKRQAYLEETLSKRTEALNDASDKALETTRQIRDNLKGQVQEIASMTGQISGHAQTITHDFEAQREALEKTSKLFIQDLEDASGQLKTQEERLVKSAENSTTNIIYLNNALQDGYTQLNEAQSSAELGLNSQVSLLEEKAGDIRDISVTITEDIASIQASLDTSFEMVEPMYKDILEQSNIAKDDLASLKTSIESEFDTTLEKLKKTGITFETQTSDLREGAEEAREILEVINHSLQNNTKLVIQAADETEKATQGLLKNFESKAEDIHITADKASLKIDGLQKSLSEQVSILSNYVGQSVSLMETAERGFGSANDKLKFALHDIIETYDSASEKALSETKQLNEAAEATLDNVAGVVTHIESQTEKLLKATESNLLSIKQNGDHFAVRAMELEAQMKASLGTSQKFGQELRDQAASLAEAGHKAADEVSEAISQLSSKCAGVSEISHDVKEDTRKAGEAMAEHAKALEELSRTALEVSDEAAHNFAKHSDALAKSAQDALEHVKSIQEAEAKVQRDAFFTSAKFVIESLHSLSVDMTRQVQNGEVSEKLWKLYQKGDLGVFTQRLADASEGFDEVRVREKFTKDTEFRSYVQRFIRQFEELFEQAEENDHGAMLTSTFVASDVGKLYLALCKISGRPPKTQR